MKDQEVLQLQGGRTLLERVSEAPQRRLQMSARPTTKKAGVVKRERGPLERVAESPKMSMGSLRRQQRLRSRRPPNRRSATPSLLER